jgi:EpsI family protein
MRSNLMAMVIAGLMVAASIGAVVARPERIATQPTFSLEGMIPKSFGDWQEEPRRLVLVVNPQQRVAMDEIYSQTLERIYVSGDGYQIMLSVAHGPDHRGPFRTHEPESCYPAQGFALHRREVVQLETPFGQIPIRRLSTSKGPRKEPVTYWIMVGDKAVLPSRSKLAELGYVLTGRVPDGLLFRVSSIDANQTEATRRHDEFITQMLRGMSPPARKRISGLGDS